MEGHWLASNDGKSDNLNLCLFRTIWLFVSGANLVEVWCVCFRVRSALLSAFELLTHFACTTFTPNLGLVRTPTIGKMARVQTWPLVKRIQNQKVTGHPLKCLIPRFRCTAMCNPHLSLCPRSSGYKWRNACSQGKINKSICKARRQVDAG